MRPLTLHASALNDDEYALYTSSMTDLALCDDTLHDDRFYEEITISVRETRAWLRGRYPDIPVATIDAILKFFSPTLGQGDTLSGGQFFATLRLVVHVQNGKELDRSLAFVQARPSSSSSVNGIAALPQPPRRSADSHKNPFSYEPGHNPPLHPSQRSESGLITDKPNNPFVTRSKSLSVRTEQGSSSLPPLPPRKPSTSVSSLSGFPPPKHASSSSSVARTRLRSSPSHISTPLPPPIPPPLKPKPVVHVVSPLIQQSLMASKTANTMKKAEAQLEKERVLQVLRSSATSSPFASSRASREGSPSKSVSSWSGSDDRDKPPALPRRRPRHSPAMSASSLEQVALAAPPATARSAPYTPSPFDSPTKPIMDLPPPTHPDRKQPSLQSISVHVDNDRSFEAIYSISPRSSPTHSPLSPSSPSISKPPFSFSNDPVTPTTPTQQGRVFRSKSLHYHPTNTTPTAAAAAGKGPPPVPPPKPPMHSRKKRPESIQVLSPSSSNGDSFGIFSGGGPSTTTASTFVEAKNSIFAPPSTSVPNSSGQRRSSYSSSINRNYTSKPAASGVEAAAGTIQRKLQELHLNAMPVLEKARYKAEAGLSPRRGFIPSSSSAAVNGVGAGGVTTSVEGRRSMSIGRLRGEEREGLLLSRDDEVGQDSGDDEDGDERIGTLRGKDWRVERPVVVLRDEMKWPVGEGWNRL